MSETLRAALLFLVNTLFDLYLFILVIRLLLVWVGANYFDPIVQFITKMTNIFVKPLRRIIPNYRGIEFATVLLIIIVELIKFFLIGLISIGMPNFLGLLILAMGDILKIIINTFFYAILIQVILSWVQPYSPANQLLYQLTSPIMRPLQRVIPPIGGFDITPIFALIGLQFLMIILVSPLLSLGFGIAFG